MPIGELQIIGGAGGKGTKIQVTPKIDLGGFKKNEPFEGYPQEFADKLLRPFIEPDLYFSLSPTQIERGANGSASLSTTFDANGDSGLVVETRLIFDGNTIKTQADATTSATATFNTTTIRSFGARAEIDWKEGPDEMEITNWSLNRTVTIRPSIFYGKSTNGNITTTAFDEFANKRIMLPGSTANVDQTFAAGEHSYLIIPSNMALIAINDQLDNLATVPLNVYEQIATVSLNIGAGNGIVQPYTQEFKILRTTALAPGRLYWRHTIS